MWREFRNFLLQGNVLDLAIAVIIGAAFGKIVTSLVEGILMPPIGLVVSRIDFSDLYLNLSSTSYPTLAAAQAAGAPVLTYGVFLNDVISFLIIALVIFAIIRLVARVQPNLRLADTATKECPYCLSLIPLRAVRCRFCTADVSPGPVSST